MFGSIGGALRLPAERAAAKRRRKASAGAGPRLRAKRRVARDAAPRRASTSRTLTVRSEVLSQNRVRWKVVSEPEAELRVDRQRPHPLLAIAHVETPSGKGFDRARPERAGVVELSGDQRPSDTLPAVCWIHEQTANRHDGRAVSVETRKTFVESATVKAAQLAGVREPRPTDSDAVTLREHAAQLARLQTLPKTACIFLRRSRHTELPVAVVAGERPVLAIAGAVGAKKQCPERGFVTGASRPNLEVGWPGYHDCVIRSMAAATRSIVSSAK